MKTHVRAVVIGGGWGARFDRALSHATRVILASEQRSAGSAFVFDYANMLLTGLATLRARQIGAEMSLLAVWDGGPGDRPGRDLQRRAVLDHARSRCPDRGRRCDPQRCSTNHRRHR